MAWQSLPPSRDALRASLTDRIIDGELPAGSKLPSERELALASGLSRPIVREVLRGLEQRGFVEIHPGRGSFVTSHRSMTVAQSLDSIARADGVTPADLIEARLPLERRTAELAALRATPEDVRTLAELAAEFDRAADLIARARIDLALHGMIAKAAHNPVLETMFGAIAPLVFLLQVRSVGDPAVLAAGGPLHHTVLEAIRDRDAAAAGDAMESHLRLAATLYGADVDRPLDAISRRTIATLLGDHATLEEVIADVLGSGRPL